MRNMKRGPTSLVISLFCIYDLACSFQLGEFARSKILSRACRIARVPLQSTRLAQLRTARTTASIVDVAAPPTLQSLVDQTEQGGTLVLRKGTYTVDGTLKITKNLAIVAEEGAAQEDIIITGTAPADKRGVLIEITAKVSIKGLTVKHNGGSATLTLSTGMGSMCIYVKEDGFLDIQDCRVTTETSTAIVASGRGARLYCDTCSVGPCGWECDSASGYGICVFAGAYGEGIVAFFPDSICTAIYCDVGPSQLVAVSAEGGNSALKAVKCSFSDSEWKHGAEYDGGVLTFDRCTIDSKSKLGEVTNVVDCTFV